MKKYSQKGFAGIGALIIIGLACLGAVIPRMTSDTGFLNVGGGSGTINSLPQLITSKNEGTTLTSRTASLDFVGAGVTATNVGNAVTVTISGGGGGGSSTALDLGDNGVDESSGITEIATTGDTNSIFSEPSADKLLIAVGNDWPKSDTSDDLTCTDCIGTTEITDSYVLNTGDTIDGTFNIGNGATSGGILRMLEDTDNGANYWQLSGASSLASNVTCTIDASGQIPDACVGDGTDADTATPSVGSAGAIQYSDGSGAFLGSLVDNLFYNDATDILYLLDDTTTYFKAGAYDTGFKFNANGITSGFIHTLTVPDADMTLVGSDVSNIWTARQEFTPSGGQAGLNVGSIAGDPVSTSNGDIWYDSTANELTAQINGSLVALGSGGGSGDITSVGDVTSGAAFDGTAGTILTFNDAGGDKTLEYDNTNNWFEVNAKFTPATDNTYALGTTGQYWSDLFLGDGAVIDINSDITLTHSADALTVLGGEFRAKENLAVGNTSTSSGILKILEDTDDGSNFATFQVPALAANTVYILPPDDGDAGEQLQTNGSGTLTWEAAGSGGSGTVTNTGGNLTSNSVVLGAGTVDTKVVAGITTDGTSQLNLGVNATTLGKLKLFGNTSGDVTLQPNAVAGTGIVLTLPATTGTLVTGGGTASGTNTGDQTITLTGDVTGSGTGSFAATVGANAVALTTDTTGNYVANVSTDVLTGLTGGSAGSEGASLSLAFDYSQVLSGDAGLASKSGVFGASGLAFEGDTANTIETFISVTDPTASDKTITIPDRSGTVSLSGDTFTGDVTGTLNSSGATALTIASDSVALTTDTTGNYVSSATASGGLTLTGTEGASLGILLPAAADALSATTSSGSGLQLLSGGLTLLQGCSDGQVLAWAEATDLWACSSAGGGSGDITSVGDVASGAAFDGTQGTILTFNDADGDKTIEYDNTNNQFEVNANWLPSTNDGASLGSATQSFSDLFLASGAVANWNNGDMTLTHSSNALRFGGGVVSFSDAAPTAVTGTERVIFEDADGSLSDWSFRVGGEGSGLIAFAAGDGTLASPALKDEFDNLGEIAFYGHDGTNYEKTASIYAYAGTGTTGNNDMPSTLAFRTTPDGSNTMVTAVQINQAGALLANSGADNVMYDCVELGLDPYSNITTGTDKDSLVMPYAMTVTNVYASLTTGPTGSVATFDINEAGTSIISTKITIDASETSSQTAATAAVISDSAIAKGSKLSFDIDGVGSTTPGNGVHLQVCGPINY